MGEHTPITEKREPINDADWMTATRARCSTSTHRHRCSRISDEGEIVAREPSLKQSATLRIASEAGGVTATEKNRGVGLPCIAEGDEVCNSPTSGKGRLQHLGLSGLIRGE
jgi:hypothetical protein